MKKKLIVALMFPALTLAQVGIGTQNPDASAILDLESNSKGFLPPRLSSDADVTAPIATGLFIYDESDNCLNVYNGTVWVNLCESGGATPPPDPALFLPTADFDGDGVPNNVDLDDDNDGILDTDEYLDITDETQFIEFEFENPSLVSGTANSLGAVYKYTNASPGIDVQFTILELDLANLNGSFVFDNDGSYGGSKQLCSQLTINPSTIDSSHVRYKVEFFVTGTSTPFVLDKTIFNFLDIDGATVSSSVALNEIVIVKDYQDIILGNPTDVAAITNVDGTSLVSQSGSYTGLTNSPALASAYYENFNQFELGFEVDFSGGGVNAPRTRVLIMSGDPTRVDYINNPTYVSGNDGLASDTDGDGIPNQFDLDSDGDGCPDAYEGGATANQNMSQFDNNVGTNGLHDSLETTTDNGTINYTLDVAKTTDGTCI